jgi:molecular chaperone GrpE (heat shock protein)
MREDDGLNMYADSDDQKSIKQMPKLKKTAKTIDIMVSEQRMSMVNPEYVESLQLMISRLESKIKSLDATVKRLSLEIKNLRTESERYVKK